MNNVIAKMPMRSLHRPLNAKGLRLSQLHDILTICISLWSIVKIKPFFVPHASLRAV